MDQRIYSYEGMFLLDSSSDFETASEPVKGILTRYTTEILSFKPWDDRKLAYEIRGRKRGLYVLAYFKADPEKIREIEHDCELDERVIRQLILRRDKLTQEQIDAQTPATGAPRPAPEDLQPGAGQFEDRGDRSYGDRGPRHYDDRGPRRAPEGDAPPAARE
jgi:small subunit ribosomal protein S6